MHEILVRQGFRDFKHHDRPLRLRQPRKRRRERHVPNARAGGTQSLARVFEHRDCFGLRAIPFVGPAQADPRNVGGRLIDQELVPVGERSHEQRDVGYAAGEGAHVPSMKWSLPLKLTHYRVPLIVNIPLD